MCAATSAPVSPGLATNGSKYFQQSKKSKHFFGAKIQLLHLRGSSNTNLPSAPEDESTTIGDKCSDCALVVYINTEIRAV